MPGNDPSDRLTCFKAYDVRGRLGLELNSDIAERIGCAFAEALNAGSVVLGRDCRATSQELADAVASGLQAQGADVLDLGLCGTEEVYFATDYLKADGGICVTASHNPIDYNGMKFVKAGAAPLDEATDFPLVARLAARGCGSPGKTRGSVTQVPETRAAYVEKVLSFVDCTTIGPVKMVVNAGNGAAGPTFDAIAAGLAERGGKIEIVRVNHWPDGTFPNGIPNPLLPENQPATGDAVVSHKADLGVAWDGDFDRCFLFDHKGRFIPGEYVVGILAEAFLGREAKATIVHDPRVVWNTQDIVRSAGGNAVIARTGHAFVKKAMRETGAIYGGELSAHHYFRDFMACDSGMVPWLLALDLMARKDMPLAGLVDRMQAAFPSSGEINFEVADVRAAMERVETAFASLARQKDMLDGLSLSFDDWRMNLRASSTEPLLRLNVESRGDTGLVDRMVSEIRHILRND